MIGIALFLFAAQEKPWDDRPGSPALQTKGGYNVELVGWVDSVGRVSSLAASEDGRVVYAGGYLYDWTHDSLKIIDISDPAHPYIYKTIGHDSLTCEAVTVVDTFLYVWWYGIRKSTHIYDLYIYRISDPLNPVFLREISYETPQGKGGMVWYWPYIHDTVLYGFGTLKAINVADPLDPKLISYPSVSIWAHSLDFPFPYSFHIAAQGTNYGTKWEIWDLSDPANMFLVHRDSVYEVYEPPYGIAAWEYNGKRYVYIHAGTFDYSYDVTNPTNPILLNWGARDPRIYPGIVHGTRYYASSSEYDFVVLDLTDPVYEPVIAWYDVTPNDTPLRGTYGTLLWVNGYVIARAGFRYHPNASWGLAIYHYKYDFIYDTIPPDTIPSDTLPEYLEWVRTIYREPGLEFSLKAKAHVSLSLFNSSGQRAYEKDMGELGPGPHTIPLPGLKPGVYFLELRMDNKVLKRKVVFTQEGSFLEPERRPDYGPGYLAPPPWEALARMNEKPSREIHVLPLDFSCKESSEIVLHKPKGREKLCLSPELTDSLFRLAIVNNVLHKGAYSWIPGLEPVLYTGKGVYAPGYYRVFYLEPPVIAGSHWGADSVVLLGKGYGEEQGGYPYPIEDMKSPYAVRIYRREGIEFYARVILLPEPEPSELSARVRVHLWATKGIVPESGLDPGLSRECELRLERDGQVAGGR